MTLFRNILRNLHQMTWLFNISNWRGSYWQLYTEGYSESTEPIDAVNILPLARFEPTTSATPPSTTPDTDATNCAIYIYFRVLRDNFSAISTQKLAFLVYVIFRIHCLYYLNLFRNILSTWMDRNEPTNFIHIIIGKIYIGIVHCHFSQICNRVKALDWHQKSVF